MGFAYSSTHTVIDSPDPGSSAFDSGDRSKIDWQGNVKLFDGETLVLGAEHSHDEIHQPVSAGTVINSGYAELQSDITADIFNAASLRYDDNSYFGSDVTFREAPAWLIRSTGTKLKASFGTGFKAPTLSEMFESFPAFGFYANPDLRPEKSTGYDAGFEQSLADDASVSARHGSRTTSAI